MRFTFKKTVSQASYPKEGKRLKGRFSRRRKYYKILFIRLSRGYPRDKLLPVSKIYGRHRKIVPRDECDVQTLSWLQTARLPTTSGQKLRLPSTQGAIVDPARKLHVWQVQEEVL